MSSGQDALNTAVSSLVAAVQQNTTDQGIVIADLNQLVSELGNGGDTSAAVTAIQQAVATLQQNNANLEQAVAGLPSTVVPPVTGSDQSGQ